MKRKIIIVCAFIMLFCLAFGVMVLMKHNALVKSENVIETKEPIIAVKADDLNKYNVDSLDENCRMDDKIYCAVEKVVKCTMNPKLTGCDEEHVPNFVLGDTDETERPKNIAFEVTKIKKISTSNNISVYTQSDCDAQWFGLCKGTVIYSLQPEGDGEWRVTNVYALE